MNSIQLMFSQSFERELSLIPVFDGEGLLQNIFSGGHNNPEHQFIDIDCDFLPTSDSPNKEEYKDDLILTPETGPMQTAVSPVGRKYLYISSRGIAQLLVYDTETDTLITQVPVSGMPMLINFTSDGNKIYVGSMMTHSLNVIEKNGNTWTKTEEITHPGFSMLHGSDITTDDRYVYVSSRNTNSLFKPYFEVENEGPPGTIGIIDTQTDEVVKLIEIEEFGAGLVVEK